MAPETRTATLFSAGFSSFLLGFLVMQIFNASDPEPVLGQILWVVFALLQTGGLIAMTLCDLDMNVYAKRRKAAVASGFVYFFVLEIFTLALMRASNSLVPGLLFVTPWPFHFLAIL